ncbi:MAG: 3'-5' exonuclease [[Lactobacillus] timonensis]|jgi:DNA polymerase-3 subunit epsilon|uniref:3'-5' exonuclease n=1 Tax=[Lactobacillus] timonensis TaxID=1970790 RepID=UPI000C843FE3|nr:3'-5' exonuclease [[Lactobacillus] timonensis]MCI1926295.1 3'-5' exonuclease [[Lactobacillus] timonensis]MCI1957666.1 3'-5' exonuclease [[Lactobacillus] timonensis]MCI1970674.1 3'-5' exonuclease [[Lactobacillus] timonensis]MCI2006830.1 3'-5' exonuclease [[Lactobacillus] timonensis]
MNFVAMDFETAAGQRYSACSLALAVVRNSQVVDEFYTLINPQTKFFWRNVQIHGIHEQDVANAPLFPEVWQHINQFFTPDQLVIAHNNSFDNSVLAATLTHYGLVTPAYLTLDTVKTSRYFLPNLVNHKLDTVCDALNINLHHHHNALDDAQACANILITETQQYGAQQIRPFITMRG